MASAAQRNIKSKLWVLDLEPVAYLAGSKLILKRPR